MVEEIKKISDIDIDKIINNIDIDEILDSKVIKRLTERREKLKDKGLYEGDILRILEDKVLKYFDAYVHTNVFDVLVFKDEDDRSLYLVGFEIKSDRDNPIRIFEQLPQYVYICDAVYLVLGEKVSIPKNLPSWVGVLKVVGNGVKLIKYGGTRLDLLMRGKSL